MRKLELLAPAKNKDIGVAAIDCGADSVYIAGPKFGARESAGNSFADISELCRHAEKFGAKVYLTLNTILYDSELEEAQESVRKAYEAGVSAVIVQDLALLKMKLPPVPLYASTQTDIRTPEKAALLESLGFRRLILARELSLQQIRDIRKATSCELEFFVHGALCVCYSGQCYLSRYLTGRSANRGECAQACRSDYTLADDSGEILVRDEPLLSLKDYNLSARLRELADAGITSFKIEGRLKNISYVKNVVSHYDNALREFSARSSLGKSIRGFTPEIGATFNRGYTEYNIDGIKREWKSRDGAKYLGEPTGKITGSRCSSNGLVSFTYSGKQLNNGDGLTFVTPDGRISGGRANSCSGDTVTLSRPLDSPLNSLFNCSPGGPFNNTFRERSARRLPEGTKIFRNFNIRFERDLEKAETERLIEVNLEVFPGREGIETVCSLPQEIGKSGEYEKTEKHMGDCRFRVGAAGEPSKNPALCRKNIIAQLSKRSGEFMFEVTAVRPSAEEDIPFFRLSVLNSVRNTIAEKLRERLRDKSGGIFGERIGESLRERFRERFRENTVGTSRQRICGDPRKSPEEQGTPVSAEKLSALAPLAKKALAPYTGGDGRITYLANVSNRLSRQVYNELGFAEVSESYETRKSGETDEEAVLMRTKYCIRKELGLCLKERCGKGARKTGKKLFLLNGKNRLALEFDCKECEMLVKKG